MRYSVFLVLVLFIIGVSCSKKYDKDYSLTIEEYQNLGMSDPSMEWNRIDFADAYHVLSELKWEKPLELPKKGSKKSGLLFSHMVSLKNISFLEDDSLTLQKKAMRMMNVLQLYQDWIDLYSNPRNKTMYYHRELNEIYINRLHVTQKMLDIGDEINRSDVPSEIMMRSGYEFIQKNYLAGLFGFIEIQSNSSQFLKNELELMADSTSESIVRNKDWMDSVMTNDLKKSLHTVMDSTSSDYIRNKYIELSELL